jgi:two-component system phosphate regulon sensor histidine kinase PhoR
VRRLQLKIFVIVAAATLAVAVAVHALGGDDGPTLSRVSWMMLGVLVAPLLASVVIARMLLAPLGAVRQLAEALTRGQRDPRLIWSYGDERDATAVALNQMADRLGRDIDEAKREAQQLEAVMSGMVEGVLVLDLGDRIQLVNPGFRELFRVWGPVNGRSVLEVIRQPEIDDLLREARDRRDPVVRDVRVQGGGNRTVLAHAVRFPSEGPPAGTLAVFHDVTDVRRVDRVRRDFIANASHELRTPLTSIQGYAETLASGGLPEDARSRAIETILRNVTRMRDLIDDLMELSRIENEGMPLERSRVDVVRLARELLVDQQKRIQSAGLTAQLIPHDDAAVLCDRAGLHHVLENLVTNAIRYSDVGGRITLSVEPRDAMLEITVADTGIGIPEEARERIFERFYRVDAARSRAVGSTGLGLAIVRHLVQAMGGTIRVESELGEGSRFIVSLPRARVEEKPD